MLVLNRELDESIDILCPDGTQISILVTRIVPGKQGGRPFVRLGIDAPREYEINRADAKKNDAENSC